jgi:pimeloyl-ACP methyl ester carboxylesterase
MQKLLLIPAFACDERLYAQQIKTLSKRIAIQTTVATADRFDGMVKDILEQVEGNFAILGTSMGGRLALEIALAAPDRVEALCVIGASAGATADVPAGLRRAARIRSGEKALVVREMGEKITHFAGPRGEAARQGFISMGLGISDDILARQADALAHRVDRWEKVATIQCPTLCLWGAFDQFSPAHEGVRLAETVQDGSYVELPDCGHVPTLEYPDQATAAIALWLEDAGLI